MKITVFAIFLALGLALFAIKKYSSRLDTAKIVAQLLEKRHSGYSFDPTKQVSNEQIKLLIRAAQLAPSSYNEQPWNFIICDKKTNLEAYNKAFSTLVEFNQNWAQNAQILVVIATSKNSQKNNAPNLWAEYDTGAAAFSMAIQATSLGLMTHQMAGFDENKISELFKLPEDIKPISIMAIGYESENNHSKPRERKPTEQNFFHGDWNH